MGRRALLIFLDSLVFMTRPFASLGFLSSLVLFVSSASGQISHGGAPPTRKRGICYNFRDQGECQYGDNCRFSHDLEGAEATEDSNDGFQSQNEGGFAKSEKSFERKPRGKGECYEWKNNGACRFGDRCRFTHPGAAESKEGEQPNTGASAASSSSSSSATANAKNNRRRGETWADIQVDDWGSPPVSLSKAIAKLNFVIMQLTF